MKIGGDVGGTKTLLEARAGAFTLLKKRYENDDFPTFEALLAAFLDELRARHRAPVTVTCLAVAGPVTDQAVRLTNRPDWLLSAADLSACQHLGPTTLVNDFVAVAAGLSSLEASDTRLLQAGEAAPQGPVLALGPGTGLGVAMVDGMRVLASEGGHIGFAPFDEESTALWRVLGAPALRVTAERVVSGSGLAACYCLMAATPGQLIEPAEVVARAGAGEALAQRAVRLFARSFGAVAGDLALVCLARGGVYLAGGITPRLPSDLFDEPFLAGFRAKAEHATLVAAMPVTAVLSEEVGLRGALHLAAHSA